MKLPIWNSYWKFAALAGLFGILTTLGWLQYRWIGELSERERERSERNLNIAVENLTREFDREITRAFVRLQISPATLKPETDRSYAARYEQWRQTALYPELIGKIYAARVNDEGGLRLTVFDDRAQRFEAAAWSPPLAAWHARLEEALKAPQKNATLLKLSAAEEASNPVVLLIPISSVNLELGKLPAPAQIQSPSANRNTARPLLQPIGYTIILLNTDYLKNDLLPSLISRYLNAGGKDNGYQVIVRNRQTTSQIVYQTSGENPVNNDESAVERDFFSVRLDEIENLVSSVTARSTISQDARFSNGSAPNAVSRNNGVVVNRIIMPGGIDSPVKNITPVAAATVSDLEPRWQIVVQPQIDPLAVTAGKTRRRNLLISGGILLLLGANGLLLIILSNRALNFARQQRNFVASVSHELRTPLTVIRSLSENLADGIVKDDRQTKQYGELINDEERRLSAMVEQILDYAAGEKYQDHHSQREILNVVDIINAALDDYRMELGRADFQVELFIEPILPPVLGDRDALRRAFGNLVSNAVKYSSNHPRQLTISARFVRRSGVVEICFADQGGGISAKDLPHIFTLFYRGQAAAANPPIKGSGIGLSLVKQIVEAHRGTVAAASQPGQGSILIITLPAARKVSG